MNEIYYVPRHYNEIELWRHVSEAQWNDPRWQQKNAIHSVEQLKQVIQLSDFQAAEIHRTVTTLRQQGKEPLRITPYYASLMQADPFHPQMRDGEKAEERLDPIFWQSVPTPANLLFPDTGIEAAMGEEVRSFGAAYQRYPNRVALLVAENTSCASYCVHCQRAKSLDAATRINRDALNRGIYYIASNPNINEVLVTGGDSLMISRTRLRYILEELGRIPHLRVIRLATRVPVVMPMAITDALLEDIRQSVRKHQQGDPKHVYFMTHINHYQEITNALGAAVQRIQNHGYTVRNQTVLLNHVNSCYITLAETFRRMVWAGVHPYYLLQCHKERGITHFITPVQIGKIYMKHLQGWLSGICMPRYAANIEGGGGKVLLMPSGHDTLNTGVVIDSRIAESYATVYTWDGRIIEKYEALGRATRQEFATAKKMMEAFIGRKKVFMPRLILVDKQGNIIKTTHRSRLPQLENRKKARQLGYGLYDGRMPLTNPAKNRAELERGFVASRFHGARATDAAE
ncbi:MAG: KamA family radical SAM protein [Proteobacteria bacterium]|nr:KamA family radical SAM protein [Pseudomonadota bacterium]